jgi:hypothetical protein
MYACEHPCVHAHTFEGVEYTYVHAHTFEGVEYTYVHAHTFEGVRRGCGCMAECIAVWQYRAHKVGRMHVHV